MILEIAAKCKKVLVVEEASVVGGLASEVADILCKNVEWKVQFAGLGIPDDFVAHGPRDVLLAEYGLSPDGIAKAAMRLCKPKGHVKSSRDAVHQAKSAVEGVT